MLSIAVATLNLYVILCLEYNPSNIEWWVIAVLTLCIIVYSRDWGIRTGLNTRLELDMEKIRTELSNIIESMESDKDE